MSGTRRRALYAVAAAASAPPSSGLELLAPASSPPLLLFPPAPLGLVLPALAAEDLHEGGDPLSFTENCVVRACGAVVVGGVMGFGIGALFSGYGAMAPYDPALRDWQLTQEHLRQQQVAAAAAAAKGASAGAPGTASMSALAAAAPGALPVIAHAATSATAPAVTASSAPAPALAAAGAIPAAKTAPRNFLLETLAPVHLPELGSPLRPTTAAPPLPLGLLPTLPLPPSLPHLEPHLHPHINGAGALPFPSEPPPQSIRAAFVSGLREMRVRGLSSARSFGIVGGVFTLVECSLEKLRGTRDMKNAIASGFITGAIVAAPAGPAAMVMGGAGFGAFSAVIEVVSPYLFDH